MEARETLVALINELTNEDGVFITDIPGLYLSRLSSVDPPPHTADSALFCVTVQGDKCLHCGKETIPCQEGSSLLISLGVPITAQIVRASPERPFLGLTLAIDLEELSSLRLAQNAPSLISSAPAPNVFVGPLEEEIGATLVRMLSLLKTPRLLDTLLPLVRREILFRLLSGDKSGLLASLTVKNSQAHRIALAVEWLKANYASSINVESLAKQAHMSTASLHHWFKAVTRMSPMQYQKLLRLQNARQLLFTTGIDVAGASREVGYESSTQFNREYKRQFGAPPGRDIERLHALSGGLNAAPKELVIPRSKKKVRGPATIRLGGSLRMKASTMLSKFDIHNSPKLSLRA